MSEPAKSGEGASVPSLRDILAALPRFSPAERQRIVDAIKALSQFDGAVPEASPDPATPATDGTDAEMMLQAISQYLKSAGVEYLKPAQLRRSNAWAKFRTDVDALGPWIESCGVDRIHRASLFLLAVGYLREHLAYTGLTVGSRMMMQNISKLPAVMDSRFPGYAKAGMLRMLIRGQ